MNEVCKRGSWLDLGLDLRGMFPLPHGPVYIRTPINLIRNQQHARCVSFSLPSSDRDTCRLCTRFTEFPAFLHKHISSEVSVISKVCVSCVCISTSFCKSCTLVQACVCLVLVCSFYKFFEVLYFIYIQVYVHVQPVS